MNPVTARTLIAAAIIADLIGAMVMSPTAWFWLAILAAILAACPAVFARKAPQISGIVILTLSIGVAVMAYPAHKKSMEQYAERVKQLADKRKAMKPAPAPAQAPAPVPMVPETAMRSGDEAADKEAEPANK